MSETDDAVRLREALQNIERHIATHNDEGVVPDSIADDLVVIKDTVPRSIYRSCIVCPDCGSEVDVRTAEAI